MAVITEIRASDGFFVFVAFGDHSALGDSGSNRILLEEVFDQIPEIQHDFAVLHTRGRHLDYLTLYKFLLRSVLRFGQFKELVRGQRLGRGRRHVTPQSSLGWAKGKLPSTDTVSQ